MSYQLDELKGYNEPMVKFIMVYTYEHTYFKLKITLYKKNVYHQRFYTDKNHY